MENKTIKISSSDAKKKQQRNLAILGIVGALLLWGVYMLVSDGGSLSFDKKKEKREEIQVSSPLGHVDESKVWVERTQNAVTNAQKATDTLQQQLAKLNEDKANQQKNAQLENQQLETLQSQVKNLEDKLNKVSGANVAGNPFMNIPEQSMEGVSQDSLKLSQENSSIPIRPIPSKNPDTYVPSGTFARAVLIGSADASAAVNSQSNPSPVLLRILDQGTLPNHEKSHLKNCTATAAAVGDISAERAEVRIESLTCVSPNHEIIEIPKVEATVFGPDGKNGIRGKPLWREGALLKRAFLSGALSGLSQGIATQYMTVTNSPIGTTASVSPSDIFKYGGASGVGNAMDKVAEYNIKRAEQYHPVIQISAGTVVDIAFLKGFYLDGAKHDDKTETVIPPFGMNTSSVSTQKQSANYPLTASVSQLPLSSAQIEALKTKTLTQGHL